MSEIIKTGDSEIENEIGNNDIIALTESMLEETRSSITDGGKTLSVPIAELFTLGAGVSSLVPSLNTVTQTTTASEGLYRLVNAADGVLKPAKNGNSWGVMKTKDGISKLAQFQKVSPTTKSTITTAFNPATMMMAAALFSIEKDLAKIADMEKQILIFLETEKESEIEADVETLMGIARNYKYNWDNEHFVSSNHKLVLDIQRTARKNMTTYQKRVDEALKQNQLFVIQNKVNSTLSDLKKKFQYYRLSLYTFSLASMMEAILSGNYNEEYLIGVKNEITTMSDQYRELFGKCSSRIEKMGSIAIETNVVKGIGTAGKAVGKLISNIPLVKNGTVDEFLQDNGNKLCRNAARMEERAVTSFAALGNPETGVFVEKMEDIVQIYNHTSQICFDRERIYFIAD